MSSTYILLKTAEVLDTCKIWQFCTQNIICLHYNLGFIKISSVVMLRYLGH